MASKAAAGGLALLGIGALLLFATTAGAEEKKKEEPKRDEPKPPPPLPSASCVRTQPGDGPANGKEAAVRAWQKCLIDSGCLSADGLDGKHGPMTEGASKLYEASGGKGCSSPYQPPSGGGGGVKTSTYRLDITDKPAGKSAKKMSGTPVVQNEPISDKDEKVILGALQGEADMHFGNTGEPGSAVVYKNSKKIWSRDYPGVSGGGSSGEWAGGKNPPVMA